MTLSNIPGIGMLRRWLSTARAVPTWPEFKLSPDVRKALVNGDPIVALESTIITHGMPFPENVQTAEKVEAVIRKCGAVPATIAILDGTITIGLISSEIERLGKLSRDKVTKASRRDFGMAISQGRNASTTVAATMYVPFARVSYS